MSDADQRAAVQDWNHKIITEFREHHGKLGGQFEGAPVLLLHTRGAKSGIERVNPMMFLEEGPTLYVFASKAGADTNPDWYHNLVATPVVTAELGDETITATAVPVTGAERDRIYAIQKERYPGFAEYEAKTTRVIPVVALRR
jgi:deazaflavin-dependent oxidoreductase (nitroreductase family)